VAFQFGDVLLATLVFSDTSGAKKRPVMVVHDAGDADLLVVPVTSHAPRTVEDVSLAAWAASGSAASLDGADGQADDARQIRRGETAGAARGGRRATLQGRAAAVSGSTPCMTVFVPDATP